MKSEYIYKTKGVCSREILIKTDDDTVEEVAFVGGCAGNASGIAELVKGMKIDDVIEKLSNIKCGTKESSCPDQLSTALFEAKNVNNH